MEQPSPAAAQALGLAVVYQHLSILEDLTVAENMVFAMPRGRRPPMHRAYGWTRARVAAAGARIDPAARVDELGAADRQLLEIAKALALESKMLVLDEPTESLTRSESEQLFEKIRSITETGTAVVYISHRLPEVKSVADRITVLRDGETRGTVDAAGVSEREILNLIIGRSVEQAFPDKPATNGDQPTLLEVKVPRLTAHSSDDRQEKYRSADDLAQARMQDPVHVFPQELRARGLLTPAAEQEIQARIVREVDEGTEIAEAAPLPDPATATRYVYAETEDLR